jgi:hypothetical protein
VYVRTPPYLALGNELGLFIPLGDDWHVACLYMTTTPRIVSALTPHGARREPLKHYFRGFFFVVEALSAHHTRPPLSAASG